MGQPKKRRFLVPAEDLKAARASEEKVIEEYGLKPLDDSPDIAESTAGKRKQLMVEWRDKFSTYAKLPYFSSATKIAGSVYLAATGQELTSWKLHQQEPLQSRAWTYQERILSRRTIFSDKNQWVWECNNGMFLEHTASIEAKIESRQPTQFPRLQKVHKKLEIPQTSRTHPQFIYTQWYEFLQEFGNRHLSYYTDALPALSGVAAEFATVVDDEYLGGIWKKDFSRGLLWTASGKPEPAFAAAIMQKYHAPSWSWATCVGQGRSFRACDVAIGGWPIEEAHRAELLDCSVIPSGPDPMGQLSSASYKIRGWARSLYISTKSTGDTITGLEYRLDNDLPTVRDIYQGLTVASPKIDNIDWVMQQFKKQEEECKQPQLRFLCLLLEGGAATGLFLSLSLPCLILTPVDGFNARYRRVGVCRVSPQLDPEEAYHLDGTRSVGERKNYYKDNFDGTWGGWDKQVVELV